MGAQYPISVFLQQLINECGGSPADFVAALGYRNSDRGLKRLKPWLDNGEGFAHIIGQIGRHFYARVADLNRALYQTLEKKDSEAEAAFRARCEAERESFSPFIYARGEQRMPIQICMYGITGGASRWNIISIPDDILRLGIDEQLTALPALMSGYRNQHRGSVPFFGKLLGFKLVRLLDHFEFDRDALLVRHVDWPFRPGDACVWLA